MNEQREKSAITVIGDSTIDNKVWVAPGIIRNIINSKLGFKRESSAVRIQKSNNTFFKPELSVIEHLTKLLPDDNVHDFTNDGFTTKDVLNGAYRDKVFEELGLTDFFPHQHFKPLEEAAESISKSEYVILSIGGNNFREFLQDSLKIANPTLRHHIIKSQFDRMLNEIYEEYIAIVRKILEINKNAKLILMTQYYPSLKQNTYDIYEFLNEVGRVLQKGTNPNNPLDVIHGLIRETYAKIFNDLAEMNANVIVADVTSSLDPFDKSNHVSQIEPSGVGGQKIAQILSYLISENNIQLGKVYRFLPEFFKSSPKDMDSRSVVTSSLKFWSPKHPNEFINKANYNSKNVIELLKPLLENDQENVIDLKAIKENVKLQQAIIVLHQVSPKLITNTNISKLTTNKELPMILAAAHNYLNSGRFGIFHTHGRHGMKKTLEFVEQVMKLDKLDHESLLIEFQKWLKTSNVHHSSRAYYASQSGFFNFDQNDNPYVKGSKKDRERMLKQMLASPEQVKSEEDKEDDAIKEFNIM